MATTRPPSTPSDIDAHFGARRKLEDSYVLHADSIKHIRRGLEDGIGEITRWLDDSTVADYWVEQLWQIDRALRQLGIAS